MQIKKYKSEIILGFIILFGILVRLTPTIFSRDLWYDEAFTGILLRTPWGEMNQMIFDDVHPPLYYWLTKLWGSVFGYSPVGIRSFSAFLGVLIVPSVYWVSKKLFHNSNVALLSASLVSFSPFTIQYSQEARMYSLFGLLFIWMFWFFYKALDSGERKYYVLWGVFAGLCFYTHYLTFFFLVMFYVSHVLHQRIFYKKLWRKSIFGEKNLWLGIGVIALFFVSWLKVFIGHISKGTLGWVPNSYPSEILQTLQIFFVGHPYGSDGVPSPNSFRDVVVDRFKGVEAPIIDQYSLGLIVFMFLLVGFVYLWMKKKNQKEIMILSIVSLGTLLLLVVLSFMEVKLYVPRYFIAAALLIFILFSGISCSVIVYRSTWLFVIMVYFGFLVLLNPITYTTNWNNFSENRDLFINEKTVIITGNPFDYVVGKYYFENQEMYFYNKLDPGESFDWVLVKDRNKISHLKEFENFEDVVVISNSCEWEGVDLYLDGYVDEDFVICGIQ